MNWQVRRVISKEIDQTASRRGWIAEYKRNHRPWACLKRRLLKLDMMMCRFHCARKSKERKKLRGLGRNLYLHSSIVGSLQQFAYSFSELLCRLISTEASRGTVTRSRSPPARPEEGILSKRSRAVSCQGRCIYNLLDCRGSF